MDSRFIFQAGLNKILLTRKSGIRIDRIVGVKAFG
jgi:hypothetical protein